MVEPDDGPTSGTGANAEPKASRPEEPEQSLARLVVGLGNPGARYAQTRHNVGFRVVSEAAAARGLGFSRHGNALLARSEPGPVGWLLPLSYMNLSGGPVLEAMLDLGAGPEGILVVCDDMDLPVGTLRARREGSSGGHRGLLSIEHVLGSRSFARLKVGVGRPPPGVDPVEHVLLPPLAEELATLREGEERAVAAVAAWLERGIDSCMSEFNG